MSLTDSKNQEATVKVELTNKLGRPLESLGNELLHAVETSIADAMLDTTALADGLISLASDLDATKQQQVTLKRTREQLRSIQAPALEREKEVEK